MVKERNTDLSTGITFYTYYKLCRKIRKQWAKHEKDNLNKCSLSEWIKSVRGLLKSRTKRLKRGINTICYSLSYNLKVKKE